MRDIRQSAKLHLQEILDVQLEKVDLKDLVHILKDKIDEIKRAQNHVNEMIESVIKFGWDGDWFFNGDLFSFTETYPDFDINAVAAHGKSRGVRLIGHHETSGSVSNYEKQMGAAFDLYEANHVRQVKTGYVADAGDIKRLECGELS